MNQLLKPPQAIATTARFKTLSFSAATDTTPTAVTVQPGGRLSYVSPHFRAAATVECTTPPAEGFTVGFIQQCETLLHRTEYARGFTTWEIATLPVGAGDGREYPWFGTATERVRVPAGAEKQVVSVGLSEHFAHAVGLTDPTATDPGADDRLRGVDRNQSFTLHLVARSDSDGRIVVLKRTTWGLSLKIRVNWDAGTPPTPAAVVEYTRPHLVVSMDGGPMHRVDPRCLAAPNADAAQKLFWTPKPGTPGSRRPV